MLLWIDGPFDSERFDAAESDVVATDIGNLVAEKILESTVNATVSKYRQA